jgi:dihydropteroate synthase
MLTKVTAPTLRIGDTTRRVDGTLVMGVVNASPESFSDAGRYTRLDQRLERCEELIASGADIIDVGGQSAITNRPEIDAAEEVERVVPIVEWLARRHPEILVSIDTYKPRVADAALAAGASILNDVSGLRDPALAGIAADRGAALVIMHTAAKPLTRLQQRDLYDDVASEVIAFLSDRMEAAHRHGVPEEAMILDPGPDFTKTPHQTVAVLRRVAEVRALGRPLLLALSRKDFLGAITGRSPAGRDAATAAAIAHFAATPGNIVRVHDVAAARDVVATVDVLAGRSDLEPDYLLPDEIRHERPGA